jgi:hypothetical protein
MKRQWQLSTRIRSQVSSGLSLAGTLQPTLPCKYQWYNHENLQTNKKIHYATDRRPQTELTVVALLTGEGGVIMTCIICTPLFESECNGTMAGQDGETTRSDMRA